MSRYWFVLRKLAAGKSIKISLATVKTCLRHNIHTIVLYDYYIRPKLYNEIIFIITVNLSSI